MFYAETQWYRKRICYDIRFTSALILRGKEMLQNGNKILILDFFSYRNPTNITSGPQQKNAPLNLSLKKCTTVISVCCWTDDESSFEVLLPALEFFLPPLPSASSLGVWTWMTAQIYCEIVGCEMWYVLSGCFIRHTYLVSTACRL